MRRDSVFVDRTRMTQDEISGQNGVVHVLDDLLIPDRGQSESRVKKNELYGSAYCLPVLFHFGILTPKTYEFTYMILLYSSDISF